MLIKYCNKNHLLLYNLKSLATKFGSNSEGYIEFNFSEDSISQSTKHHTESENLKKDINEKFRRSVEREEALDMNCILNEIRNIHFHPDIEIIE